VSIYPLGDIEQQRERVVRTVACPVCNAQPGYVCWYDGNSWTISHTGRYDLAARQGLVPPLAVSHA
jgi:hypothetical protein